MPSIESNIIEMNSRGSVYFKNKITPISCTPVMMALNDRAGLTPKKTLVLLDKAKKWKKQGRGKKIPSHKIEGKRLPDGSTIMQLDTALGNKIYRTTRSAEDIESVRITTRLPVFQAYFIGELLRRNHGKTLPETIEISQKELAQDMGYQSPSKMRKELNKVFLQLMNSSVFIYDSKVWREQTAKSGEKVEKLENYTTYAPLFTQIKIPESGAKSPIIIHINPAYCTEKGSKAFYKAFTQYKSVIPSEYMKLSSLAFSIIFYISNVIRLKWNNIFTEMKRRSNKGKNYYDLSISWQKIADKMLMQGQSEPHNLKQNTITPLLKAVKKIESLNESQNLIEIHGDFTDKTNCDTDDFFHGSVHIRLHEPMLELISRRDERKQQSIEDRIARSKKKQN